VKRPLQVLDLGLSEYDVAHRFQLATVEKVRAGDPKDHLLLVEHPEVYTFGRKSSGSTVVDGKSVEVERGGEATYHNPGQMVAYPIIKLESGERDVHLYLRNLEVTLIQLLSQYGLDCEAVPGATGVWVKASKKKIASIGVAVRHWITYHGVALNVSNELAGFQKINPCGFSADIMTSLQKELGTSAPRLESVKNDFVAIFRKVFDRAV